MICEVCNTENRAVAVYCKRCGKEMKKPAASTAPEFDRLAVCLNRIAGLEEIKAALTVQIKAIVNRKKAGFEYDLRPLSMILTGDTGTGKSFLASVYADALFSCGITKNKGLVTVAASGFQEFSGKLKQNLDALQGGVLLIDHVHQLVPAGYVAGQPTLMDKLYAEVDSRQGDPVILLASKEDGFREYLKENPEVGSRFHQKFYLPHLSFDQMLKLAENEFGRLRLTYNEAFREKLKERVQHLFMNQHGAAGENGRGGFLIKKEINMITTEHFSNAGGDGNPAILGVEDIKGPVFKRKTVGEVLQELDSFVGMDSVKAFITQLTNFALLRKEDAEKSGKSQMVGAHMVLTGNPGTGKTTLARKLGEVMAAAGVLSSGHVIEVDRSKLVGMYIGETPLLVQKYCDEARGGVLLIDEAYTLKNDDRDKTGQEAIDTLLKRMEDDRGEFIVIAAGYEMQMQQFINSNPGIKSRFGNNFFSLPDYTPSQLLQILRGFVSMGGYELSEEAGTKALLALERKVSMKTIDFGNGREARVMYEQMLMRRADRISRDITAVRDRIIYPEDVPYSEAGLSRDSVGEVLGQLNVLVGLENVKKEVNALVRFLEADRLRVEAGQKPMQQALHFLFLGNPGTGKTTVARLMAKIFKGLGVLPTDKLVEVTDKELIGQYSGETSPRTNKKIDEAMGGVLFIDEAYMLTAGKSSYGAEVVTTLLKRMEDDRGKFIVIAAGYAEEMNEFLDSNPGIESRFTNTVSFDDYGPEELYQIALNMFTDAGLVVEDQAQVLLRADMQKLFAGRTKRFANGRSVRTRFKTVFMKRQSERIIQCRNEGVEYNPLRIIAEDIAAQSADIGDQPGEILSRLNGLTGLKAVKKEISALVDFLRIEKLRNGNDSPAHKINLHFIFKGRPGTGKTTVARLLGGIFKELGILPEGQLVETSRKDLVGEYVGVTAIKTSKVIDKAQGGVLFIDEAYTLTPAGGRQDFGQEAVDELLKRMEDDKGKFVVIVAGYSNDMDRFMASNEGLASRFTREIVFEDYLPGELMDIFMGFLHEKNMWLSPEAEEPAREFFADLYRNRDSSFANGRTVRNIFESCLTSQAARLVALMRQGDNVGERLREITMDDISGRSNEM